MREKISACVITYNEEGNIDRCLGSLSWCDEIVVMDSFSEDRTIEIARKYTDRIYQHKWLGYIGQRNLIREKARCPWVLFLDADEEISPALLSEIKSEFGKNHNTYAGFRFPRRVYYTGKWIMHGEWNPDIKLRLFKKDLGYSAGVEPHDQVVVDGPVKTLKNPIHHYTYDSIWDHIDTINRFSGISAHAKYEHGVRFRWLDFIFRPPLRFLKGYLLKKGFLDGRRGYLIAFISAFGVLVKYAKLWEIEVGQGHGSGDEIPGDSCGSKDDQ